MFEISSEAIERFQQLQAQFESALPDKLQAIAGLWAQLKQQSDYDAATAESLCRAIHSLAGTAGTFGYKALGKKAKELEQQLVNTLKSGMLTSDELVILDHAIAAFCTDNQLDNAQKSASN